MKGIITIVLLFSCLTSIAQTGMTKKKQMLKWVELVDSQLKTKADSITINFHSDTLRKLKWPSRPRKNKIKNVEDLQALVGEFANVLDKDTAKLRKQNDILISVNRNIIEPIAKTEEITPKTIVDAPKKPVAKDGRVDPLSENIRQIIMDQQHKNGELMKTVFNDHYVRQKNLFEDAQKVLKSMENLSSIFIEATYEVQRNQRSMIQLSLEQEQRMYRLKLFQAIAQVRNDFSRIERKR